MSKLNGMEENARVKGDLRFAFGKNWSSFLAFVNEVSLEEATRSITNALRQNDLANLAFLDIGCGSGLFSLAARRLGAVVRSFDFDVDSVRCTEQLKEQYYPHDPDWIIERVSVLDADYVKRLGLFDVVYAWGVLHHTGDLRRALGYVASFVRPGGHLIISIYNDQGHWSKIWLWIKRTYNRLPGFLRLPFMLAVMMPRELRSLVFSLVTLRPTRYLKTWFNYRQLRGMSKWHDLVDWVGGYPFEVAKPEEIVFYFKDRGFELVGMTTCAGEIGCNEYVFRL